MNLIIFYLSFFSRWLKFYFKAKTRHDIHSPFLHNFVQNVLENNRQYYTFFIVEGLRKKLLNNHSKLNITDYGAGSMIDNSSNRTISQLAKNAAISSRLGQTLFNIVRISKPRSILELGTSLGISTLYQAGAAPLAKFITIEGCPETARVAANNLRNLGMNTIEVKTGSFEAKLPESLQQLKSLDLLYIDGDHKKNRTLSYYNTCLPYANDYSVFIIADIHWSSEMEQVWETIKGHPEVSISIDLFDFGVLLFRKENQKKIDLSIVKYSWKPWRMGFF
jgi:predicted O-methyltransferase YrrM